MKPKNVWTGIFAILFSVLLVPAVHASLIGGWALDEGSGSTANDSSTNDNDGTVDGSSWVASMSGYGYALDFDGSNDYLSVVDDNSLDITSALTIELWVNQEISGYSGNQSKYIIGKGTSYRREPYLLIYSYTSNEWYFRANTGDGDYTVYATAQSGWHHLAAVFDGSSLKLYIDGELEASTTFTATTLSENNSDLMIGGG